MSTDFAQDSASSVGDFADLPFRLFVCIADRDPGVNVREAESFMQLIQNPGWTRSPALGAVLAATDGRYSTLWKEYVAGHLTADAATVRRRILEWLQSMAESERPQAQADFNVLARNLFNARAPWWRRRFAARARGITLENLLGRLGPASSAPGSTPIAAKPADAFSTKPLMDAVLDPSGFWRRGGVKLRCIEVIDETPHVKTFRFAPVEPVLFCYKAGQAATLEVPIHGTIVRRSYTISSSPSRPLVIDFTIKRIPGGQVSNWLHANLRCGTTLTIHGPHGRFNYYDHPSLEPVLLSAGSGITPMLAITRWLTDTSTPARIDFLHYASKPSDFIARTELEQLQARFKNLRVTWVCSRPDEADAWSGERGRVSLDSLQRLIPDFRERDIFLCGPAPFMETVREMLLAAGCDKHRIHQESFGVRAYQAGSGGAQAPAVTVAGDTAPGASYTLRLCSSARDLACGPGQTVLEALEAAGLAVPYSCRSGACGTCKIRKRSGAVVAGECEGLSAAEQEQGYFLSCCARPTTDLELEM
jgi:glycine betaine monooxygenase B